MAWHSILYTVLTVVGVIFAAWKGGAPERTANIIVVIATVASDSVLSRTFPRFASVSIPLLIIDVVTFLAFTVLALKADRFWPMIVAGFQGSTVVVHVCHLIQPDILPYGYSIGVMGASDINAVVILVGVFRHYQRVKAFGSDRDWSA